jgi:hypothetical protein
MSAIPPIDVATPNRAMQASASMGTGAAEAGHPFAEIMRSAVSSSHTKPTTSGASGSSRLQSSRSNIHARTDANRVDESVADPSSQDPNGNPATWMAKYEGKNTDPLSDRSSSAAVTDGDASLAVDEPVPSLIGADPTTSQSSGVAEPAHRSKTEPGSSTVTNSREQISSSKDANAVGSGGASGSSAIPTSTSTLAAYFPGIVAHTANAKVSAAESIGSSAASDATQRLQSMGSVTVAAATAGNEVAASGHGSTGPRTVAAAHNPTIDGSSGATSNVATAANSTATSTANQNGDSAEDTGGSPLAGVPDGNAAHASTNDVGNSAADGSLSNPGSATAVANSAGAGDKGSVGMVGNGASASTHGSDVLRSSNLTAAIPSPVIAEKSSPDPHANPADLGLGLHDSSSLFSAGSHSGASGNLSASTTGSTAARATASDAFAALDSASAGERGVLLHAAPHQVSVGVSDPSLGWVEVRAERVSGEIAAALTTSSAASHAALTSVLPAMATYLQQHQAGVQQVHVETSLSGGQAGTGSQGQSPAQSDARSRSDNSTVTDAASNTWTAAPVGRGTIPMNQGTSFIYEGHHFSIRA